LSLFISQGLTLFMVNTTISEETFLVGASQMTTFLDIDYERKNPELNLSCEDYSLLTDLYQLTMTACYVGEGIEQKMELSGVRLDSGDLVSLSKQVRSLLPNISIFASGDLDEWEISRLKQEGAEIDSYGLGTKLVTGSPVNGVYKLVDIEGIPVRKESSGKLTYPGKKQIFRSLIDGKFQKDTLGLIEEKSENAQPLLQLFMKAGKQLQASETLTIIRQRTAASVASLPAETRRLENPTSVKIEISEPLQKLTNKMKRRDKLI
jgi:nicotinate phosphoribosyltransferase